MNPIPGKGSRHRAAPFFLLRLQSLRPESPLIIVIRILSRESASVRHRDHSLPLPRNAVLTRKALFTPGRVRPRETRFFTSAPRDTHGPKTPHAGSRLYSATPCMCISGLLARTSSKLFSPIGPLRFSDFRPFYTRLEAGFFRGRHPICGYPPVSLTGSNRPTRALRHSPILGRFFSGLDPPTRLRYSFTCEK